MNFLKSETYSFLKKKLHDNVSTCFENSNILTTESSGIPLLISLNVVDYSKKDWKMRLETGFLSIRSVCRVTNKPFIKTRKHSNRMHTTCMYTVHASVASHQMSVTEGGSSSEQV